VAAPGISSGGDCNAGNGGTGCGVTGGANGPGVVPSDAGGEQFNKAGGGVYATLWSQDAIQVWMWNRADIPEDVRLGKPRVSTWPAPYVSFRIGPGTMCPREHFANHKLVINQDFCGAWAGVKFARAGVHPPGPQGCSDYVSDAGSDLSEAYWLINYVKAFNSADSALLPWSD